MLGNASPCNRNGCRVTLFTYIDSALFHFDKFFAFLKNIQKFGLVNRIVNRRTIFYGGAI